MSARQSRSRLAIPSLEGMKEQFEALAQRYPDIWHAYMEHPIGTNPDYPLDLEAEHTGRGYKAVYEGSHAAYLDGRWVRLGGIGTESQKPIRDWAGRYYGSGILKFDALAMSVDSVLTTYPVRVPLPGEVRELAARFPLVPSDAIILPCGLHRWARILHWLGWAGVVMPIDRLVWHQEDFKLCEPSLDPTVTVRSIADNLFLRSALAVKWVIAEFSKCESSMQAPGPQGNAMLRRAVESWLTVTEAAKVAFASTGTISRAVDAQKLKSNGEKGRKRLIDSADLSRWILARSNRAEPVETNKRVEHLLRKARSK